MSSVVPVFPNNSILFFTRTILRNTLRIWWNFWKSQTYSKTCLHQSETTDMMKFFGNLTLTQKYASTRVKFFPFRCWCYWILNKVCLQPQNWFTTSHWEDNLFCDKVFDFIAQQDKSHQSAYLNSVLQTLKLIRMVLNLK